MQRTKKYDWRNDCNILKKQEEVMYELLIGEFELTRDYEREINSGSRKA